jgi:chromosome segregation ATPase
MEDITPQLADCETLASRSASALRELQERARSAASAQRGEIARVEADINKQLDAIAAAINDQQAHEAFTAERTALEAERDDLQKKIAELEAARHSAEHQWQSQLADFERRLHEQQTSWNGQRAEWDKRQAALQLERGELQQKFDLALADVQRFRGRVAELEQELARRPETKQADSAELVALRAERDALAGRVEELEQQPAPQLDADTEQQLADLQRRFEMAVEDVRELKTKNAALEQRLATSSQRPVASTESGGMDWESQKRRLLASLEETTDGDDPLPEKERLTIEGTIEMTDAVVAEKDREIERLKAELAESNQPAESSADHEREQQINELLDADEVIAEHRKRIAQLEREMEDKLRTAELELSVERAKMARQKVELEELRSDLESQRQAMPASGPAGAGTVPRRRWLSKLGISGDE